MPARSGVKLKARWGLWCKMVIHRWGLWCKMVIYTSGLRAFCTVGGWGLVILCCPLDVRPATRFAVAPPLSLAVGAWICSAAGSRGDPAWCLLGGHVAALAWLLLGSHVAALAWLVLGSHVAAAADVRFRCRSPPLAVEPGHRAAGDDGGPAAVSSMGGPNPHARPPPAAPAGRLCAWWTQNSLRTLMQTVTESGRRLWRHHGQIQPSC